jgi:hypothetical protein
LLLALLKVVNCVLLASRHSVGYSQLRRRLRHLGLWVFLRNQCMFIVTKLF